MTSPLKANPTDVEGAKFVPAEESGAFQHFTGNDPTFVAVTDLEKQNVTYAESNKPNDGGPRGYPQLSTFIASDQNMMVVRGFTSIHVRLLLNLQSDIQYFEGELRDFDDVDDNRTQEEPDIRLQSWQADAAACRREKRSKDERGQKLRTRHDVLKDLYARICQYVDNLLIKLNAINRFERPGRHDLILLKKWIGLKQPLIAREQEYVQLKGDLWSLKSPTDGVPLERFIGKLLLWFQWSPTVQKIFRDPDDGMEPADESVISFSPPRIRRFVSAVEAMISVTFLVAPILAMYKLARSRSEGAGYGVIGILMGASLTFTATMTYMTSAKRHEVFGMSAAYCAVLVVFVGATTQG